MPAVVVGHVRDPLPHHRVREQHARPALVRARGGESFEDRLVVVAVDLDHIPIECAVLVG